VAVADELNFGRAAARLYLSQPALSRQISSLERLVGCELLRRSTHRVELTLAGEALLGRARELLQSLDEAVSVTRSLGGELLARVNRHWELAGLGNEVTDPGQELQELRDAVEALHAQFEPPPGISVRPVNAAGVAALLNSPGPEEPATILYLHCGGYMTGSAFGYRPMTGCLTDAAKAGVVVPDYRLAPEYPFPAAVEDAVRAYLWMLDQGTDAARVTVTGDSAGRDSSSRSCSPSGVRVCRCPGPPCSSARGPTSVRPTAMACQPSWTGSGACPPGTTSPGIRRTTRSSAR
jgi:monoterpene epsilon-lactone hydrolase